MLSHVAEQLRFRRRRRIEFGGRRAIAATRPRCARHRLPRRVPARGGPSGVALRRRKGIVIEKRVFLPHMQNTVHVIVRAARRAPTGELRCGPSVQFPRAGSAGQRAARLAVRVPRRRRRCEICAREAAAAAAAHARGRATDATFTLEGTRIDNVLYPVEESRGYQARGDAVEPGLFQRRRSTAGNARR